MFLIAAASAWLLQEDLPLQRQMDACRAFWMHTFASNYGTWKTTLQSPAQAQAQAQAQTPVVPTLASFATAPPFPAMTPVAQASTSLPPPNNNVGPLMRGAVSDYTSVEDTPTVTHTQKSVLMPSANNKRTMGDSDDRHPVKKSKATHTHPSELRREKRHAFLPMHDPAHSHQENEGPATSHESQTRTTEQSGRPTPSVEEEEEEEGVIPSGAAPARASNTTQPHADKSVDTKALHSDVVLNPASSHPTPAL